MLTAKSRRCFHRVASGLEFSGDVRFLTLTSTRGATREDMQRHFRALMARLKRRGLVTGYIQVPEYTKSGLLHKHVLLRGRYIDQLVLSQMWQEIHGAKIVDIRRVRNIHGRRQMANEMAKYMAKGTSGRYSWDWGWVWQGFCKDWQRLKRAWRYWNEWTTFPESPFSELLQIWRGFLRCHSPDPLRAFLDRYDPGPMPSTEAVLAGRWGWA